MAFRDFDGDGKITAADDFLEYQIYKETTGNNNGNTPGNNSGSGCFGASLQGGYNAVLILVVAALGIISPILTELWLLIDAKMFFEEVHGYFFLIITIAEVIALLVAIYRKVKRSSIPDLSKYSTEDERKKATEDSLKKQRNDVIKYWIVLISVAVAIGAFCYLQVEIPYQKAVQKLIDVNRSNYSFELDTENHPNYKDTKGWKLYYDAKHGYHDSDEAFLEYHFYHINKKQDAAIESLRKEVREYQEKEKARTTKSSSTSDDWYSSETTTYSTTERHTTTTRPYTTRRSTTSRSSDPYDVNDYAHADDFYYDHYDDFWDYEDAEDYYNKHYGD